MSGSALQQHIHMNQCGEAYFERVRMERLTRNTFVNEQAET